MGMITINRKNGCAVQYSESPLKLPNGDIVLYKIEGIMQPEGVSNEEMEDFLKYHLRKVTITMPILHL